MSRVVVSSFVAVVLSTLVAAPAFAQDPPAAEPATTPPPVAAASGTSAAGASESKMRVALNLVPMPFLGKLSASVGGMDFSSDAAFAFGIMPVFDYLITPMIFVGAAPMYTLNVKSKDAMGDAAKELDLMLRVGANFPIADKLMAYGYLSPGYSMIMPPEGDSAKGFLVGVHAGAAYDVAGNIFVNGQLGYSLGFQKLSVGGTDVDFKTTFLQIGLGGGIRL